MMYIHYCKSCNRIFILNGHKMICPRCVDPLVELRISYLDYVSLNLEEREILKEACADEEKLRKLKTRYRMYKYSKWYKDLQAENKDNLPITTLLAEKERSRREQVLLAEKEAASKRKKRRDY